MLRLHESQQRGRPMSCYMRPASLEDALTVLAKAGPRAKAVAGGTDFLVESMRGQWPEVDTMIDLSALDGLDTLTIEDGSVELGPLVTHSDVVGCKGMVSAGLPLAQACLEVGSPQLRNRATVVGNLVTASPANDTISALYALDASVTVATANHIKGTINEYTIPVRKFVTGYRSTVLKPGELVTRIAFNALHQNRRGVFVKSGLRRHQAISIVHAAIVVTTAEGDQLGTSMEGTRNGRRSGEHSSQSNSKRSSSSGYGGKIVEELVVALGSVGPTVTLSRSAAEIARGRRLDDPDLPQDVATAACSSIAPINDLRSTAEYRSHTVAVLVRRALLTLADGAEASAWPDRPPRLATGDAPSHDHPIRIRQSDPAPDSATTVTDDDDISVTVNGVEHRAANSVSRTLLDWLRSDLGLTGTKEGCAEGECGACTVHINGRAVLACLIPAARAEGAEVTTVEGLAPLRGLHPVQQALANAGGVQCGFCTPGFVMSAAMLTEENPNPSRAQVEHGLSGNLCRCTGYYPIIAAAAAANGPDSP